MKIYVDGIGSVTLTDRHFIAQGGEGEVYGKDKTVYKIYLDKSKMIPEKKIKELSVLDCPQVKIPKAIIRNTQKRPIGITMEWVEDAFPLCKLFSNAFRKTHRVTPKITTQLIDNIRDTICFVHQKGCLIVDGNEFNYLVSEHTLIDPYLIDTDSIQTPNFPATAVMPSIRDYHSAQFSELSDWFGYAILSCQLFIGIHPFKGTHPKYKKKDLEGRMKANVSIFNSSVTIPSTARGFDHIPVDYMNWYVKLFEEGQRMPPPSIIGQITVVPVNIQIIQDTDNFEIKCLRKYKEEILSHYFHNGIDVVKTTSKVYLNQKVYDCSLDADVIFTESGDPVLVWLEGRKVKMEFMDKNLKSLGSLDVEATHKMVVDDTLYVIGREKVMEIALLEMNNMVTPLVSSSRAILPLATTMYDGFVYSDVLGKPYLTIPFDGNKYAVLHIPELDGRKMLVGKRDKNVIVIVSADRKGETQRFVLKFDHVFSSYDLRMTEPYDQHDINFTMLENVGVILNDDDSMEVIGNSTSKVNIINDDKVSADMTLTSRGHQMAFYRGNELYSIGMK